jgi:hypothetical protein
MPCQFLTCFYYVELSPSLVTRLRELLVGRGSFQVALKIVFKKFNFFYFNILILKIIFKKLKILF